MTTSYGVIAYFTARELMKRGHDVAFIGMQHAGAPILVPVKGEQVVMYEGQTPLSVQRAFLDWKPDVGIHIRDAFAHTPRFFPGAYSFQGLRGKPKMVGWVPVQNDMLPQDYIDACQREYDLTVTWCEYGKETLLFQGLPFNKLEVIPLGYDPEVYRPLKDQGEALKAKFGFKKGVPLIGSVGVNDQHRKGWPILLKAVSFLKKKMDVDVYLHTPPEGAFLIPHFATQFGMKGQVGVASTYDKTWGRPFEEANELYNCFDVYASSSIEEGWNMPITENLAVGNPVVCTDMPQHHAAAGDAAYYVKTSKTYPTGWSFGYLADPEDMAVQIKRALDERGTDQGIAGEKAAEVHLKGLTWEHIALMWDKVLAEHGMV